MLLDGSECGAVPALARAQQVVFDPSNTFQNALTAAIKDEIVHLLDPTRHEPHRLYDESEIREGRLYLCGELVA